jgi:hypothetical protein
LSYFSFIKHKINRFFRRLEAIGDGQRKIRLSKSILEEGNASPIYHIHIRKTGGTSLNHALITEVFNADSEVVINQLREVGDHRLIIDNKVLVGWSKRSLNRGYFHFGYSHVAVEDLNLDPSCYTFTCLRDPIDRLHSHYKMLRGYLENDIMIPCVPIEGPWATGSFLEFVQRMPRQHRENQLYTFSKSFDVDAAISRLGQCNRILLFDQLDQDSKFLSKDLNLALNLPSKNVSLSKLNLTPQDKMSVREIVSDEYLFYEKAIEIANSSE